MAAAIVTGSAGLVGSETVRLLASKGLDVAGIDNDMRKELFGPDASTANEASALVRALPRYRHFDVDIRDQPQLEGIFRHYSSDIDLVVHAAAQPSHDWAATNPTADFAINAIATLNLLELSRSYAPEAAFVLLSTNKVYGDRVNELPLADLGRRLDLPSDHSLFMGIGENLSIDQTTHSVFGASKTSADVLAQEYGRYFGLRTAVFRAGCITGSRQAAAQQHGFLGYLIRSAVLRKEYSIFGYGGKQVRDNIHGADVAQAIWAFAQRPTAGAVYNIGGGRERSCSVLEAIQMVEEAAQEKVRIQMVERPRTADHRWWITNTQAFRRAYPEWTYSRGLHQMVNELVDSAVGHRRCG